MMNTSRGEKITAIFSALVAVALLGAGVAANHSKRNPGERIAQLESDLRLQLDVAYRRNPTEKRTRQAQLGETMQAWRLASRTTQNDQLMVVWLEDAIIRSMPGSLADLPKSPPFVSALEIATSRDSKDRMPTDKKPDRSSVVRDQRTGDIVLSAADLAMMQQGDGQLEPIPMNESTTDAESASAGTALVGAESPVDRAPTGAQPQHASNSPGPQPTERPAPDAFEIATTYQIDQRSISLIHQASGSVRPQLPQVQVNLAALTGRIAAYHDELDAIVAHLDSLGDETTFRQLEGFAQQVEAIEQQHGFVDLYFSSLSDDIQKRVLRPRSPASIIARLRTELNLAEQRDGDFLTSADAGRAPKYRELDQRLFRVLQRVQD